MTTRGVATVASGLVLLAALGTASVGDPRESSLAFVGLAMVAGVAYVWMLLLIPRGPGSHRLLLGCLALGLVWRAALLVAAPLVSDDVFRYVWDGRVQSFGLSPYDTRPDDPALAHLHTDVTRKIDPTSAELPTIYPPAAELFFWLVTGIHESATAMVVAVTVADLLTVLVLWRWLRMTGRSPWWVLAYAWHPLVAIEGAGGGHLDVVGTLGVVTAACALSARWTRLAASALGVAVAIKFLPVVLVPLFWGRVGRRDAMFGVGLVLLFYLPYWVLGTGWPVGSIGAYAQGWRFNGPVFAMLEPWLGTVGGLGLSVGAGLATAGWARRALPRDDPRAWAWPLAVTLGLMPTVYPWYLVWLTPFLTGRGTWPLVAWTVTSMSTYAVWANEVAGVGWVLPAWVQPFEYGLVAAVALGVGISTGARGR